MRKIASLFVLLNAMLVSASGDIKVTCAERPFPFEDGMAEFWTSYEAGIGQVVYGFSHCCTYPTRLVIVPICFIGDMVNPWRYIEGDELDVDKKMPLSDIAPSIQKKIFTVPVYYVVSIPVAASNYVVTNILDIMSWVFI